MSKTIEEIIEDYTKERISGVTDFNKMIDKSLLHPIEHVKNIAERYAQSQTQELQEQNAELVEMLEDMETAWQSLPYGHNSVRDTQNWISNIIHPQILRMREWVSKHKTKYNHLNKKP